MQIVSWRQSTECQHLEDSVVSRPLVSAVIPAYNHERFVQQTLRSLIAQTYPNLEVIILNDGSKDNTLARIQALAPECQGRFRRFVVVDKNNEGVGMTLNQGLSLAAGSYIFHLASDDFVEPDAVATLVMEMDKNPDAGLACGDADFVDENGQCIELHRGQRTYTSFVRYMTHGRRGFDPARDFGTYWSLIAGNHVPIGLLMRKEVYQRTGMYSGNVALEDYDLWLRLAKGHRMVLVDRTLAHYRLHAANSLTFMKNQLLRDLGVLYLREREYCVGEGLIPQWRESMAKVIWHMALRRLWLFLIELIRAIGLVNVAKIIMSVAYHRLVASLKNFGASGTARNGEGRHS